METFSALLAICAGNSTVPGEFPAQRPVTQSFDVFFDLRLNKRLSNNCEAGDLGCYRAHYEVTVMKMMPNISPTQVGYSINIQQFSSKSEISSPDNINLLPSN